MNEFLAQFLIESREFVEQAGSGLLTLESTPDNSELRDDVFRAFHTLKGGAGIVEFGAMERAVHAAEDVLSAARAGRSPLTSTRIGDCLACLDQVGRWLDAIERTGEVPTDTEAAALAIIRRFEAGAGLGRAGTGNVALGQQWINDLQRQYPGPFAQATAAVRFVPDADCFFHGEDPVSRLTALPNLLALAIEAAAPFPALDALDPFRCNLVLTALVKTAGVDLNEQLARPVGEYLVVPLSQSPARDPHSTLSVAAREILAEQAAMLGGTRSANFPGRIASAGVTAANVLRRSGLPDRAAAVARHTQESLAQGTAQGLLAAIESILVSVADPAAVAVPAQRPEAASRTLRIDADRIDALVRLTSELIVEKNALGHLLKLAREQGNSLAGRLKDRHGALEHLISELQTAVLGMRVLPLRSVFQRFPRIVREMSATLGKPLKLVVEGEETEADKAIVEMLFEPLLHMVRNAVDHGVESPSVRAHRGKPATATLTLSAARQADQVLIEVRDDGGGVDVERVRQVARDRALIPEERLHTMSEAEVVELIFAAGFTTAAELTELSGRGVGMDAVRMAAERVGGRVSIDSRSGLGTTIRIHLPFSVMMTRVMTVEAGGQVFGIPLDVIVETLRVPGEAISRVGAARAVVVRERTVPVLELSGTLGVGHAVDPSGEATLVIAAPAGQWVALQVDRLGEQMEAILQPMEGLLSGTAGMAGTTLLGDGRVLLVLDVGALLL